MPCALLVGLEQNIPAHYIGYRNIWKKPATGKRFFDIIVPEQIDMSILPIMLYVFGPTRKRCPKLLFKRKWGSAWIRMSRRVYFLFH